MTKANPNRTSSSGLFLMELMISMLIFAIAASGTITVFVRSHTLSHQSRELNRAMLILNAKAEELRGLSEPISEEELYYSDLFEITEKKKADYVLTVSAAEKSSLEQITLSFNRLHPKRNEAECIYTLTLVRDLITASLNEGGTT